MSVIDSEEEKNEILKAYRRLLRSAKRHGAKGDLKLVRKAFDVALEAHKDMRRKSGEPYIFHPIAVAEIVTTEIGLGAKSIVCALLHDTVEDSDMTIEDMQYLFGDRVALIIDGLTKLSGVMNLDGEASLQTENFRKMLLTMSSDIRVILIKLADRLHNMRTLESMRHDKQLKIASETMYLYAPLAHRLGLYQIKSELEDLSFKYLEPEMHAKITEGLQQSQRKRTRFINKFSLPIIEQLTDAGLDFDIKGRPKSVFSIAQKMKKQNVDLDEIFDIFAIRIILNSEKENEKGDCWKAYSIVSDSYRPYPDRLRDWISNPKSNGYESLHTTVMSHQGKWVEVQIRTKRMDDIAEKGLAAHWKYKGSGSEENNLDDWLGKVREVLESPDPNALDFVNEFKQNLLAEEIFVFTPKGELRTLPAGSTALDFAFDIHTEVGFRCMGAKVDGNLVPLSYKLNSGDQLEVLTSSKQTPKKDWLNFVVTAKAKSKVRQSLKDVVREEAAEGKKILERKLKTIKRKLDHDLIDKLTKHFRLQTSQDLFVKVAHRSIEFKEIRDFIEGANPASKVYRYIRDRITTKAGDSLDKPSEEKATLPIPKKGDMIVIGDANQKVDFKLSPCCNPIPGDKIFGYVTISDGIKIHRTNCPNAINLRSNHAYRIMDADWADREQVTSFETNISIKGLDDVGLVTSITKIISTDLNVNMKSLAFDSNDGVFEGNIRVMVEGTMHLNNLIKRLEKVKGIKSIHRVDVVTE
ncbi:MAG: guanosine-3',5'-bis(diphosphate) 3'-pyrophosphohydrolase [Granulosicoccus sp.]|jgi:guanosine-3',5'-bis(diphosphate) 3'-pyrophosphohydrolase